VAQATEHLVCKSKALNSNSSATPKKQKQKTLKSQHKMVAQRLYYNTTTKNLHENNLASTESVEMKLAR
jgi:hypothetical protein